MLIRLEIDTAEALVLRDALREFAVGLKSKRDGRVMRMEEFLDAASERRQDVYFIAVALQEEVEGWLTHMP